MAEKWGRAEEPGLYLRDPSVWLYFSQPLARSVLGTSFGCWRPGCSLSHGPLFMLASLSLLPRDSIGQNRDDRRWEERARGNSLEEWSVHVLLKNQSRGVRSVIPERELQSPMQLFSNITHEPYSCCNINFIGAVVLVIWPKEWNNRKWEAEILEGREVLLKCTGSIQ